jgi:glycosyltransferase involved in cell wall biosynthesis
MAGEEYPYSPLEHYVYFGAKAGIPFNVVIDPDFFTCEYNLEEGSNLLEYFSENAEEIDSISPWFSREQYTAINKDVAASGQMPEMHYIYHGLREQRRPSVHQRTEIMHSRTKLPVSRYNSNEKIVAEFKKDGNIYCIVYQKISDSINKQIIDQSKFDPDLIALGIYALPYIKQFIGNDIDTRNLIIHKRLLALFPPNIDAIVILPRLHLGGAEKYAANLVYGLMASGLKNTLIVTTDSWEVDDKNAKTMQIFSRIQDVRVASIYELVRGNWSQEQILGLLLLRSQAKQIFVINSDLGLRTIKKYGKALKNNASLFCAFFSESPNAIGSPYSAVYLKDVLIDSCILSDNQRALDHMSARSSQSLKSKFVCLPSLIDEPNIRNFQSRLSDRKNRTKKVGRTSLIWYSRWEKFKAIDILINLAEQNSNYDIDAFGSTDSTFNREEIPSNLDHFGICNELYTLDVERYDAFVFTSLFEGMPNTVLEFAMLGVPIVASDVGGIAETFRNGEIELVNMNQSKQKIIADFAYSINKLKSETNEQREIRLLAARHAVEQRHGQESFITNIKELVG